MAVAFNKIIVQADTKAAVSALKELDKQTNVIEESFTGLQKAIGALAIGAFITDVVRMGSQLNAISKSTNIAASNIRALQESFAASGGTADQANDAISELVKKIGEAAAGAGSTQDAFAKIGVSLSDLATLSEQDIFRKTIDGLGQIQDAATRSALSAQLFGESVKTVDFGNVSSTMGSFVAGNKNMDASSRAAAEAARSMTEAVNNLKDGLLTMMAPLMNVINGVVTGTSAFGGWLRTLWDVAKVVGFVILTFTGFGAVSKGVSIVTGTFKIFTSQMGRLWAAGKITAETVAGLATRFSFLNKGVTLLVKGFTALGVAAVAAFNWFVPESIQKSLSNLTDGVKEFFGIQTESQKAAAAATAEQTRADSAQREVLDAKAAAAKAEAKAVAERAAASKEAFEQEYTALRRNLAAYQAAVEANNQRYQLETDLLGASESRRAVVQSLFDLEQNYLQTVAQLLDSYADKSRSNKEEDIKMLPEIARAIQELSAGYESQIDVVKRLTSARESATQTLEFEKFATQEQIKLQEDLQRIQDQSAKLTMSEIEQKYYDIERAADRSAEAAIRAEEARRGEKLNADEVKKYYDTARKGVEQLKRATGQHEAQSRSWSVGWGKALREYVDNATNASKRASEIFGKMTSGLEDMLVNFVKTGKFQWKEFMADMLETLLRSQIKQVLANVFSPGGLLGGIGEMFGGLFGGDEGQTRGNSASNPLYVMDVNGGGGGGSSISNALSNLGRPITTPGINPNGQQPAGSGGGLWDTVKSVGSSIGNAVSGVWNTVKNIGSSIGGAVSKAASWVGGLFDGFFANGGTIGAGKFGIVGERGPELITGPANITPMSAVGGGGTTNVYYTINAVDTQSFQQALARDPSLIYALTEKGRMTVAGGRR